MKLVISLMLVLMIAAGASAEPALSLGSVTLSAAEVRAYSRSVSEGYRSIAQYYRDYLQLDYWALEYPGGMTVEESVASDVFRQLVLTCALCDRAASEGLSLSESDEENCAAEAEGWYALLASPGFNAEDVCSLYKKQLLASRMYALLVLSTEVDEQAIAAQLEAEPEMLYEAEYLFSPSDDESARAVMLASDDFELTALGNPNLSCGTLKLDSKSPGEFYAAAKALEPGETSALIETDYGLFVLKLISAAAVDAQQALDRAIYAAREQAFEEERARIFEAASYTLYDSFRGAIVLR